MALDSTRKSAIRERLGFYRELGIGPLYRREVADNALAPEFGESLVEVAGTIADEFVEYQDQAAKEGYLPTGENRDTKLKVILDDIGPDCQRCNLAKQGRKQI